jgi:hypothetical protein
VASPLNVKRNGNSINHLRGNTVHFDHSVFMFRIILTINSVDLPKYNWDW